LTKTAKGILAYLGAEHLEGGNIFCGSPAGANALQNFQHAAGTHTTGCAFAARFFLDEVHKISGDINHAGFFIHYHQTA
jgi:hypothetical protein